MLWLVLGGTWLAATLMLLSMAVAVWRRDRRLARWRLRMAQRPRLVRGWLPPTPGG
jgi:di/tricarboxylate transporter